jgi:hypothetical protein
MVNLKKYFTHAKEGPEQRIYDGILKVGQGKYKNVQEELIDFGGHVKVPLIINTDFEMILKIIDDSHCTIGFPKPENATYKEGPKGLNITITERKDTLTIYEGDGGKYISGVPKAKLVWVGE